MSFGFVNPWHLFLPREGGHVIAFMGSGGKTSLQMLVADLYAEERLPVVLTNTTQSEFLSSESDYKFEDVLDVGSDELPERIYLHNGVNEFGKWRGLLPEQVDQLGELFPERVVLAEVDGSRKMPLKLYRAGEPVWPDRTSLAFLVMGVHAVGSKAKEVVHRLGTESAGSHADLSGETILEWRHLQEMLFGGTGYLAHVPVKVPTVLAMTGVNDQPDSIGFFEFVGAAMENPRLPLAVFCSRAIDSDTEETVWQLRTAAAERGNESL